MNLSEYVNRMILLYEGNHQTELTEREKTLIEKSFIMGLHFGQKWLKEDNVNIEITSID
jgi:hypothetical protein